MASFTHLILLSAERYVAVRHPFVYESQVTKVRIMIASVMAWIIALLLPLVKPSKAEPDSVKIFAVFILVPVLLYFPAMIYFNCVVYKEVNRSEKQITANQVSLEAKEKILKNKKAFYTTIVVLLVSFLCHIPRNIFLAISTRVTERKSTDGGETAVYLLPALIAVLNSLLNPLIYAVRIRYFRVAFIQLLLRKSTAEAEQLERKIFGPGQIGVQANSEQGENIRASAWREEQQGNETLNDGRT